MEEAWQAGAMAARRAVNGENDIMITLLRESDEQGNYRCGYGTTALKNIANTEQKMPKNFLNETGNFVTQAFVDYALPLVGKLPPAYLNFERGSLVK